MFIIFPFAQESGESISDSALASEEFARSLWWRGKPSASRTWLKRWKRESWIRRLSTRTFTHSRGLTTHLAWTSSLEDSRVSPSPTLEVARASMIRVTCGRRSAKDSTLFDLGSASSRTSTESLPLGLPATTPFSTMCSQTWSSWVTERRQRALQRAKSAHRIDGSGGSFLEWPTATVGDSRSSARHTTTTGVSHSGTTLVDAVRIWPTPTGIHADRGNHDEPVENYEQRVRDYEEGRAKGKPGKSLGVAVRKDWPTPRTPSGGAESATRKQELGRTSSGGSDLTSAVREWPTPTAAEGGKIPCSPNYGNVGLSNHPDLVGTPDREKGKKSRKKDWPTATSRDWKDSPGMSFNREGRGPEGRVDLLPRAVFADGRQGRASHKTDGSPLGLLNPCWVEELMGFPTGWSLLTLTESTG